MIYLAYIFIAIFGAIIGSFSVAQVWRLRAAELFQAKKSGEKIDSKEWKKLKHLAETKKVSDRSHCLNCGYHLKWYDLIPIFSWLSLGGKCRKCRKPIGWLEFLAEISTAIIFALVLWSLRIDFSNQISILQAIKIAVLFSAISCLVILFIYDAKWSLLPVKQMTIFNILAAIFCAITLFENGINFENIVNLAISLVAFPGIYLLLTVISKGAWVGDGDWILALGLILLLPASPVFAILMLLFSNVIGLLMIFSAAIFRKTEIRRGEQIPFGPAMILAMLLLLIFQPFFENLAIFLN
ncbi:MAG: prepilin peptidase [bacterium]|nr:prepilin peptidase [bacterium]